MRVKMSLATKYRPKRFDEVIGQDNIKIILQQQLETNTIKNTYLFCGPAGDGKTTTARILANEINEWQGTPIELDAASNNSVDDMREIIAQAKTKSLDSEYKVFILDEVHMISTAGWNAMLKLIEEPPAKSVFIFCTTNPEKIPKTILSRVQRYDFQMLSHENITTRLLEVLGMESKDGADVSWFDDAVEYIAKLADGHMRDALTLLDKCIAYDSNITLENVVNVVGVSDYVTMRDLTDSILSRRIKDMVQIIESVNSSGKDIKLFIKQYLQFVIDATKLLLGCPWKYVDIPQLKENEEWLSTITDESATLCLSDTLLHLLDTLMKLNTDIKYSSIPKYEIEAVLMKECESERD